MPSSAPRDCLPPPGPRPQAALSAPAPTPGRRWGARTSGRWRPTPAELVDAGFLLALCGAALLGLAPTYTGSGFAVVGIAASGSTPYVLGAVAEARRRGAYTAGLTCSHPSPLSDAVDTVIAPLVGPEVIAGSTRMKAGTAQKLVLNSISTTVMVLLGKTYGNLMVDVHTGSEKLKDRACRIVNIVTGLDYEESERLLTRAHWNVKAAIVMQKTGLSLLKSLARLRKAHDSMREAIGEDIEPRLRGMLQGHAEAAASVDVPSGTAPVGGSPWPRAAPAGAWRRPARARRNRACRGSPGRRRRWRRRSCAGTGRRTGTGC